MVKKLDIKDRDQVEKINELATETPYEVWLSTDTLMLDARSLLGLYALIGKRVNVVTEERQNGQRRPQEPGPAGIQNGLRPRPDPNPGVPRCHAERRGFFCRFGPRRPSANFCISTQIFAQPSFHRLSAVIY